MMKAMEPESSRTDVRAHILTGLLIFTGSILHGPAFAKAETLCPPANNTWTNIELAFDPTDVSLASEHIIYLGNVYDFRHEDNWKELELTTFVDPERFVQGTFRLWVHSARRGESGVEEVTLIHEEILQLTADQVIPPDSIWINVPYFPSIWTTVDLPLAEIVAPCHDLLAIGFVVDLRDSVNKFFFPGFTPLGYAASGDPIPVDSSFFSDVYGKIEFGLSWEYLLTRFPENYLDSDVEPRLQQTVKNLIEVGSTHIRIQVRP